VGFHATLFEKNHSKTEISVLRNERIQNIVDYYQR